MQIKLVTYDLNGNKIKKDSDFYQIASELQI